MHSYKIVDGYEFLEEQITKEEDGVQMVQAKHPVLKQQYTLKRIALKQGNKTKYTSLINEVSILKNCNAQWVIKCHKMIKTSNNLYIVYDHIGPNNLQNVYQTKKESLGYQIRQEIVIELVNLLTWLQDQNILNLNLKPNKIEIIGISQQSRYTFDQLKLRVNNFEFGVRLDHQIDTGILEAMPKSQYCAPELLKTPCTLGFHCDVYSIGKVFEFMGFSSSHENHLSIIRMRKSDKCEAICQLARKMTNIDYNKRITLSEIKQWLQKNNIQHRKVQRSKTLTNLRRQDLQNITREHSQSYFGSNKTKVAADSLQKIYSKPKQQQKQNSNFKSICLKILKKRNLSIFLLKCCQTCMDIDLVDVDATATVSFLFLKKSTKIMTSLSKFLYTGQDQDIKIPVRERQLFFKTTDYFKLQALISKELNISKKYLNLMVTKLQQAYPNLLKDQSFKNETNVQAMNDSLIKLKVLKFLKGCASNKRFIKLDRQKIKYLLLMSYIIDFDNYQRLFEQLINQEIIQLENQTLFVKAGQMTLENVIQKFMQMKSD